jgi:hypothetical protein
VLEAAFETLVLQGGAATSFLPLTGFTADTAQSYSFTSLPALRGAAAQKFQEGAVGAFRPLRSYSSDNPNYSYVDVDLAALSGVATGRKIHQATGIFQALAGLSSNKPTASSNGALKPFESVSEGGLPHPNPATASTVLLQPIGASTGLTGQIGSASGSFKAFVGLSGKPYALVTSDLLPLEGHAYKFVTPPGVFYGRYNSYSLDAFVAPAPSDGASITYDRYVFDARLGHKATTQYGGYALTATCTPNSGSIARVSAAYDGYAFSAHVLPGSIGRAVLAHALSTSLSSYTGARATLEYQGYAVSITAKTGAVARFTGTYRWYRLSASILPNVYGRAELSAGQLVAVYGIARTSYSGYSLLSLGEAVVASLNVAYVMNRRTQAVTRYTNYGFSHIVHFAGRYYGVKSDGIYLLEGDTFGGTSIDARVKTSKLDFGTQYHKRVPYAYIGNATELDVTVHTDGVEQGTYRSEHGAKRARLARGPKGRYFEFEIANVGGQELGINGVEFIAEVLSRRV